MKKINELLREMNNDSKQLVLYLFFGICTTVINTICYGFMYEIIQINNITCTIIAWLIAVLFAFFTNKLYVFKSQRSNIREQINEFTSFFSCRILTGIIDVLIMVIAVDYLNRNHLMWKLISNVIVTIINYIASKFFIFENPSKK